ncbi:MAG: VWA domain-containing protein [Planctomycetes bacterium]|nr:VWA domain-containing protein [Planctomycetota bacterium]MCB9909602.1 VWA domain-containing protein [Planctomycetota bacterium]
MLPLQSAELTEALDAFKKQRDDAPEEVLETIRLDGTKDALDGLTVIYPTLGTTYMRIRVLSVLSAYDGLTGNAALAAEFIANQAASEMDPEVQEAALVALSNCPNSGPQALRRLVETPIPTDLRERALELYIQMAPGNDTPFLKGIYLLPSMVDNGSAEKPKKEKRKKKDKDKEEDDGDKIPRNTTQMRLMALKAVSNRLELKELNEYLEKEPEPTLFATLLKALDAKNDPDIEKRAAEYLGRTQYIGEIRSAAAEILASKKGAAVIPMFMDVAKSKATTPLSLYWTMAELMQKMPAEEVTKALEGRLSKAKGPELIFIIDAMPVPCDDKTVKKVSKSLKAKDPLERVAVAHFLARAGGEDNLKVLEKALRSEEEIHVVGALLESLSTLNKGSDEWITTLTGYCEDKDANLQHAARMEVLRMARTQDFDRFVSWLSDPSWTIRQGALQALESLKQTKVLEPIITRMPEESGRLLFEFGETLFRLTGHNFGIQANTWKAWYEKEGQDAKILSDSELEEAVRMRILKSQKERSKTPRFFGIEIRSERVIFIVDVSGSMNEVLKGLYVNQKGEVRIERAKKELVQVIENLAPGTRFNIIAFSGGVDEWSDKPLADSPEPDRAKALEWSKALGAGGGTNLHGALMAALEEPDVDTILVLSDGEPSVGDLIDPGAIREDIQARNRERNIRIHTIALGGSLKILEWLAEDSGGRFVQIE